MKHCAVIVLLAGCSVLSPPRERRTPDGGRTCAGAYQSPLADTLIAGVAAVTVAAIQLNPSKRDESGHSIGIDIDGQQAARDVSLVVGGVALVSAAIGWGFVARCDAGARQ